MAIGASLLDTALGLVTGFVGKLFGKSKTNKTLDALKGQADYLQQKAVEQKNTIKILVVIFVIVAVFVVYFFVLRKGRK
jgi:uncharacterized membrane protein YvbJ